jgi:ribosomal-protein-alanine N-acetyltransferase
VEDIAVFPAFRGKGIGRQLTEQLIKTAEEEGCAFVTLEVRVSNEAAIGLYRSLGFEAVGVRKSFYEKPTEDALLMTKYLQPKATE